LKGVKFIQTNRKFENIQWHNSDELSEIQSDLKLFFNIPISICVTVSAQIDQKLQLQSISIF
jgi:hypothetical protein